jgi:hypothetical protein
VGRQLESVLASCKGDGGIQLQRDNSGGSLLAGGQLAAATVERFLNALPQSGVLFIG